MRVYILFTITFLCALLAQAQNKLKPVNDEALNPGTVKGEKETAEIVEYNTRFDLENIMKLIEERAKKHAEIQEQERPHLTTKVSFADFFNRKLKPGKTLKMKTADDINGFVKEKIRDKKYLSKNELEKLIQLSLNSDLTIFKKYDFFKFKSKYHFAKKQLENSKNLYHEILNLSSLYLEDNKLKAEFDKDISSIVVPFEKGEIGLGLSDEIVKYKHNNETIETYATALGRGTEKLKERGIHDIVLDRFSDETKKHFNKFKTDINALVIDQSEMGEADVKDSGALKSGELKTKQNIKTVESMKDSLVLSQKQLLYEGALYAKMSEHLYKLAKRDIEDSAIITHLIYNPNNFIDLDTKDPEVSQKDKDTAKKWHKWFNNLSDKKKNHFHNYLAIKAHLTDNPLRIKSTENVPYVMFSFDKSTINNAKKLKELPFFYKQYLKDGKLPEVFKKFPEAQQHKYYAMKFYYEGVLKALGFDFNFKTIKAKKFPEKPNRYLLDSYKDIHLYLEIKLNKKNKHVVWLQDNKNGYRKHMIWRIIKRLEWAHRMHGIAETLKRMAQNIQAVLSGGKGFVNPDVDIIDDKETTITFKGFDGKAYDSLNHYYESLFDVERLAKNIGNSIDIATMQNLARQNLVLQEQLWKIEVYRDNKNLVESEIKKIPNQRVPSSSKDPTPRMFKHGIREEYTINNMNPKPYTRDIRNLYK